MCPFRSRPRHPLDDGVLSHTDLSCPVGPTESKVNRIRFPTVSRLFGYREVSLGPQRKERCFGLICYLRSLPPPPWTFLLHPPFPQPRVIVSSVGSCPRYWETLRVLPTYGYLPTFLSDHRTPHLPDTPVLPGSALTDGTVSFSWTFFSIRCNVSEE